MAFGNRIISTGGGVPAGPVSATLANLDFGWNLNWSGGMAHDGTYMYNYYRSANLFGVGNWEAEASVSTHSSGGSNNFNGLAAASDGTFLLGNNSQFKVRRFDSSFNLLATYSVSGRVWDVTQTNDGFAYTDNDASIVRVYDYNGNFVSSFTPSEGTTSQKNGITWDGGALWVGSGANAANGACHRYDLNGNYLGGNFTAWANRQFAMLGYDQVNFQFYGIQSAVSSGFTGGTASRYNAVF